MAAPSNFEDLRIFLHDKQIDHGWLRTVLSEYLSQNVQTDNDTFTDHAVWEYRNTIAEFGNLLEDEPSFGSAQDENGLDDDDEFED